MRLKTNTEQGLGAYRGRGEAVFGGVGGVGRRGGGEIGPGGRRGLELTCGGGGGGSREMCHSWFFGFETQANAVPPMVHPNLEMALRQNRLVNPFFYDPQPPTPVS